jgi:hypothetical protein
LQPRVHFYFLNVLYGVPEHENKTMQIVKMQSQRPMSSAGNYQDLRLLTNSLWLHGCWAKAEAPGKDTVNHSAVAVAVATLSASSRTQLPWDNLQKAR